MVSTTAERMPMAKAKGRPTTGRTDRVAKIDATVLGWAKVVAKAKGVTLAEYLSEALRPIVAKDFGRMMEAMKEGKAL